MWDGCDFQGQKIDYGKQNNEFPKISTPEFPEQCYFIWQDINVIMTMDTKIVILS